MSFTHRFFYIRFKTTLKQKNLPLVKAGFSLWY